MQNAYYSRNVMKKYISISKEMGLETITRQHLSFTSCNIFFSLIDFNPMCNDIDCGDLNLIRSPVIHKYLDQFLWCLSVHSRYFYSLFFLFSFYNSYILQAGIFFFNMARLKICWRFLWINWTSFLACERTFVQTEVLGWAKNYSKFFAPRIS